MTQESDIGRNSSLVTPRKEGLPHILPIVPFDPEAQYLDVVSWRLYPSLKRVYPDISLSEIRKQAQRFTGATVTEYIPLLLHRVIRESRLKPK